MSDPSRADMHRYFLGGARKCWPKMCMIANRMVLDNNLDTCLAHVLSESKLENELQRSQSAFEGGGGISNSSSSSRSQRRSREEGQHQHQQQQQQQQEGDESKLHLRRKFSERSRSLPLLSRDDKFENPEAIASSLACDEWTRDSLPPHKESKIS